MIGKNSFYTGFRNTFGVEFKEALQKKMIEGHDDLPTHQEEYDHCICGQAIKEVYTIHCGGVRGNIGNVCINRFYPEDHPLVLNSCIHSGSKKKLVEKLHKMNKINEVDAVVLLRRKLSKFQKNRMSKVFLDGFASNISKSLINRFGLQDEDVKIKTLLILTQWIKYKVTDPKHLKTLDSMRNSCLLHGKLTDKQLKYCMRIFHKYT